MILPPFTLFYIPDLRLQQERTPMLAGSSFFPVCKTAFLISRQLTIITSNYLEIHSRPAFFHLIENKKAVHDIAFSANHYRFVCNRPLRESNPQLALRRALWFCQSLSRTDMFSLLLSRTFFIVESNSGNLNTLSVKTR